MENRLYSMIIYDEMSDKDVALNLRMAIKMISNMISKEKNPFELFQLQKFDRTLKIALSKFDKSVKRIIKETPSE